MTRIGPALLLLGLGAAPALSQRPAQRPAQRPRELVLDTAVADRVIRGRRESSKAAIARHDTAGIGAILANDVVVVTSASVKQVGRAASMTRFAEQFKARPDVIYRRTPDAITVFVAWEMASERGHWSGSWTDADGKISLGGSYFAKWRIINGVWLVESETYVPEYCNGGKYCREKP
jgi:ketosteroid isomerase-like protein